MWKMFLISCETTRLRLHQILSRHHRINVKIEELYCVYCADWAGEDNKEHGWSQFSAQIRRDKGSLRAGCWEPGAD